MLRLSELLALSEDIHNIEIYGKSGLLFDGTKEKILESVKSGDWRISKLPDDLEPYRDEILKVVNENVPHGCCGGCI